MRRSTVYWLVLFLVVLTGCSKDPAPAPAAPNVKVGTVQAELTSPNPCLAAPNTCTIYPDKDTTVYGAVAAQSKDYGKGH
jgi:hypothetical protein